MMKSLVGDNDLVEGSEEDGGLSSYVCDSLEVCRSGRRTARRCWRRRIMQYDLKNGNFYGTSVS